MPFVQGHRAIVGEAGGQGHGRETLGSWASPKRRNRPRHTSVKESVFPFTKFPGVDVILGPGDAIDRRSGRPNCIDLIKNHELGLILNTPNRKGAGSDEGKLRATAVRFNVSMITTVTGARAAVRAIAALRSGAWGVGALQDYHA